MQIGRPLDFFLLVSFFLEPVWAPNPLLVCHVIDFEEAFFDRAVLVDRPPKEVIVSGQVDGHHPKDVELATVTMESEQVVVAAQLDLWLELLREDGELQRSILFPLIQTLFLRFVGQERRQIELLLKLHRGLVRQDVDATPGEHAPPEALLDDAIKETLLGLIRQMVRSQIVDHALEELRIRVYKDLTRIVCFQASYAQKQLLKL